MDLREFVSSTIIDIVNGASDAARKTGHKIGSVDRFRAAVLPPAIFQTNTGDIFSALEFDVAITSTDNAGVGAAIKVISLSLEGSRKIQSESISRVKFTIPVSLKV